MSTSEDELMRAEAMLMEALNVVHRVRCDIAGGAAQAARPEWVTIAEAAHRLGMHETSAWRHAKRVGADWPQPGVRRVDFTRLRAVRPPSE